MQSLIVGNSVYASMLNEYLKDESEIKVVGFTVEREYIEHDVFEGLQVIPYEDIEECYSPEEVVLYMGVGYSQMNGVKERLFQIYKKKGYHFGTYKHPSAVVAKGTVLGEGNVFFEGSIVQKGCRIGNGNVFFARTLIAHNCSVGDFNSFSFASLAGNVTINNRCFIGMGSVIGEKLTLDDRVFVGANTYVNQNIEKGRVIMGEKGKLVDRDISLRIM